jgi:hypothetical protein
MWRAMWEFLTRPRGEEPREDPASPMEAAVRILEKLEPRAPTHVNCRMVLDLLHDEEWEPALIAIGSLGTQYEDQGLEVPDAFWQQVALARRLLSGEPAGASDTEERFATYQKMQATGSTPNAVYARMKADGLNRAGAVKSLRTLFNMDLSEAARIVDAPGS